jgi:hypothetical protein
MNGHPSAASSRLEQLILVAAFFLLFPGFFYYHTLIGTGAAPAFLGGYFAPVSVAFLLPFTFIYIGRLRREPGRLTLVDLHFGLYLAYFMIVVAVNAAAGAPHVIVTSHILDILFMLQLFVMFSFIDFTHPRFRMMGFASLAAMTVIAIACQVDGVFYLRLLGAAADTDTLATYQGFARSYIVTFLAVIAFTRSFPLRLALYATGTVTLFLNSARSEFVALLFALPIIEFYYARHKMLLVLLLAIAAGVVAMNLDQIVAALPDNRILELTDIGHSSSGEKRHYLTVYALHTIRAHPWMGDYASYGPGLYSHNVLSAWVDLGLFGIVYLMALMVVPAAFMFLCEYFAGRRSGLFMLGFIFACVDVMLLITSHYFADMLVGATLGACSRYFYERRYAQHRPSDLRPPAPRQPYLRQAVPQLGRARP